MATRRFPRYQGSVMTFFTYFMVFVGLPLMALAVDISRLRVLESKVISATESACEAYAYAVDVEHFRSTGQVRFRSDAAMIASNIFQLVAGKGHLAISEVRNDTAAGENVVVQCSGRASLEPIIVILPSAEVRASAIAKAGMVDKGAGN